ncbi:MAG: M23 family metallopeptidase [Parvibaculum sp.]
MQRSGWTDRIRHFLRHNYVERQIYIRSHGHVQFISLSPVTQAVFAAIAFAFLSWIAFASVNVVFKEQIIASKDRRYVKMQAAYEERMAQVQAAYDELNGQLVITEERFLATTRQLEEKHKQLAALMSQRQTASSELDTMRRRYAATLQGEAPGTDGNTVLMRVDDPSEGTEIVPTTARPQRAAELERFVIEAPNDAALLDIAGLAGSGEAQNGTVSQIDARLAWLDDAQQGLINNVEEITDRRVRELKSIISMTKVIDPDALLKRAAEEGGEAQGGPFISLADGDALAGGGDETGFAKQLFRVSQNLKKVSDLEESIASMPLAAPVVSYRKTSSFGPRRDPFNGRMAFHSGEDMASSYGAKIYAPGAGTVSFAGWKGGYGRIIEIDHGNGFRTRYGHLGRIDVKTGQKIAFREVIGRVGSSGRSSGPHLHYEVWFDGIVRNPSRFIEAGHYVFAKQG